MTGHTFARFCRSLLEHKSGFLEQQELAVEAAARQYRLYKGEHMLLLAAASEETELQVAPAEGLLVDGCGLPVFNNTFLLLLGLTLSCCRRDSGEVM